MDSPLPSVSSPDLISRRAALQRTAALLGLALSSSLIEGVLRAQDAAGGPVSATPRNLSAAEFATAAAVAERIIPRTDTPGAIDVGVPAFIDLMMGDYVSPAERTKLRAGFANLDARSRRREAKAFAALAPAAQDDVLREVAREAQGQEKTFFHLIKDMTLIGYFTSEAVGKNVLHYDPVPGRFQGCIPLSDVGNRSWTR